MRKLILILSLAFVLNACEEPPRNETQCADTFFTSLFTSGWWDVCFQDPLQ